MLFNSVEFIFGFVLLVLLGFFLLGHWSRQAALAWLTAASLAFYGWWNPVWLPLLVTSIMFNFAVGGLLAQKAAGAHQGWLARLPAGAVLAVAIMINIALLVHYKYSGFPLENLGAALESTSHGGELPLGISFFTFTQIAFLVDVHQGKAADFSLLRYGLFVTYYPHLIAGPILHHRETMPQFSHETIFRFNPAYLAEGSTLFVLGLFKKTVLADQFGNYANSGFNAGPTYELSFFEAWGAALSYTLQLYFDFSGYSDMAIGLALMIGIRLPQNFHSPYKACNIAEFWRRWHMTLSRFLREYLYIPLGGNRRGPLRRHLNLMLTMLLGGLWHGAGWTFVVWGGLHGLYLVAYHAWRQAVVALLWPRWPGRLWAALAWALTFLAVVVAWVFFRAADLPAAIAVLAGMAGQHGSVLPQQILDALPALRHLATGAGKVQHLADGTVMGAVEMLLLLTAGMAIVRFAPAMQELSLRARTLLVIPCATLALQRVLFGGASEFLYFRF